MTMPLFDRPLRIVCMVLLLAVTVTGSFGSILRFSNSDVATIASVVSNGVELTIGHQQCQHPVEHSHGILPFLEDGTSSGEYADAAYAAAPDAMSREAGNSLLDPPPRE